MLRGARPSILTTSSGFRWFTNSIIYHNIYSARNIPQHSFDYFTNIHLIMRHNVHSIRVCKHSILHVTTLTGLLVRMTMLFNWRWDDGQTLPAWWTVTRTKIYATLNQRTFYLKKNLWAQALRIGRYSERCVRKSSSKYFASSPFLFFARNI